MRYRIIGAACLFIALGLATPSSARAQNAADADNAMHAMDMRMRALNTSRKKLERMEYHSDHREAEAAHDITDADVVVFSAAVKVFTVAFVITAMKCPDDVRFAQKQFRLAVESFVATANAELSRVDESVRKFSAPAALAEATHIRDAIVDLRDFLKPFAAEE